MSANLSDVSAGSTPPPPTDSAGGAAPSAADVEQASSPTTGSAGSDTAGTDAGGAGGSQPSGSAANSESVPDYLKDFPSMEELEQNKSERYAQALLGLRPAHDALLQKHRDLEPLSPFKDIVSQTTPDQLKDKLAIVDGFFSPVLDEFQQQVFMDDGYGNQIPKTTARPGLERLAQTSPDTLFQIINDMLPIEVDGVKMGDRVEDYVLRKHGLNPQNLNQYKEWERTGAPVQSSVDLSGIPENYHEVFKTLPQAIQTDVLNADPEAREHYLKREQQALDDERGKVAQQQQATRDAQARIEQNTQAAVMGKFETGFNQFIQHVSAWQPTSDEAVNSVYRLEVANTVVNLLDNNMGFASQMLYKSLGMQPDAEIPALNQQFQQQLSLVELYKARGDTFKSSEAQRSADSAYMRLVAKLNGIAGKLIEHKTKAATASVAATQAGQAGRQAIAGQPGAQSAGGGGDWKRSYYD